MSAAPGAKIKLKVVDAPGASEAGNVLRLNALFGLFVVVAIESSVRGFTSVALLLVRVNGMVRLAVVDAVPKSRMLALFGCSMLPSHWGARLLLQDNVSWGAKPFPCSVAIERMLLPVLACK